MTLLKVDFVGLPANRMEETVALFRDVLGAPVARQTDGLVGFRLADGAVLEVYVATDKFHSFFTTGPVVAFRVENFNLASQSMTNAGISFIGDVQCRDGVSWQHFYSPDGMVLEIIGPAPSAP